MLFVFLPGQLSRITALTTYFCTDICKSWEQLWKSLVPGEFYRDGMTLCICTGRNTASTDGEHWHHCSGAAHYLEQFAGFAFAAVESSGQSTICRVTSKNTLS